MSKFIVFEGIDGSGKTSQILKTIDLLKDYNQIFVTKEPTANKLGKHIKKLLKQDKDPKANAEKYTQLYTLDRKYHNKQIKKQLNLNNIVICDRYYYSTLAYQQAQGYNVKKIIEQSKKFLIPDITFIIDLPAETAIERLRARGKKIEKFEKEKFLETLRDNYLKMPGYGKILDKKRNSQLRENIKIIDGNHPKEKVFEQIKEELKRL
tara:strand:- start:4386 stop:5009 length:624 start_codon:yes stop_codon:yes gene_type:complete